MSTKVRNLLAMGFVMMLGLLAFQPHHAANASLPPTFKEQGEFVGNNGCALWFQPCGGGNAMSVITNASPNFYTLYEISFVWSTTCSGGQSGMNVGTIAAIPQCTQ